MYSARPNQRSQRNRPTVFLFAAALALPAAAQAAVAVSEIAGKDGSGPVTIFYSSSSEAQPLKRRPLHSQFRLAGRSLAWQRASHRRLARLGRLPLGAL